jgi:hypothetical protein
MAVLALTVGHHFISDLSTLFIELGGGLNVLSNNMFNGSLFLFLLFSIILI